MTGWLPSDIRHLSSDICFDIVEESRDRDAGTKVVVPSGAKASCPRHGYAWCSLCRGDTDEADASAQASVRSVMLGMGAGAWVADGSGKKARPVGLAGTPSDI
jgi:hypothetical protein